MSSFCRLRDIVESKGYDSFSKGVYAQHYQKILFHKRGETDLHAIAKLISGKILLEKRRPFLTEWDIRRNDTSLRTFDVLDLQEFNVIELENNNANKDDFGFNQITIDLNLVPPEVVKSFRILRNFLKERIP